MTNKLWLRELMDILDRNKQPSLIQNMLSMEIKQRNTQSISLKLKDTERSVANRVVICPMEYGKLYRMEFYKHSLPTSFQRKLTLDEVKLMLNKYTVLELV